MKRAVVFLVLISQNACLNQQSPEPFRKEALEPAAPTSAKHVVARGETLMSISKRYTGSPKNWQKIAAMNPGLKPQNLKPGQQITIPLTQPVQFASIKQQDILSDATHSGTSARAPSTTARPTKPNGAKQPARDTQRAQLAQNASPNDLAEAKGKSRALPKKPAVKNNAARNNETKVEAKTEPRNAKIASKSKPQEIVFKTEYGDKPAARVQPLELTVAPGPVVARATTKPPPPSPPTVVPQAPKKQLAAIEPKTQAAKRPPSAPRVQSYSAKEQADAQKPAVLQKSNAANSEQSSRSTFYSCTADRCSNHDF